MNSLITNLINVLKSPATPIAGSSVSAVGTAGYLLGWINPAIGTLTIVIGLVTAIIGLVIKIKELKKESHKKSHKHK